MTDDEDDPYLVMLGAAEEARATRKEALAIGCLVPLVLIPILIILAAVGPR